MNDPVKIVDRTFMNGVATAIYAVQTAEAGTAYMSVARSNHGNEKRVVIIVDAGRFRAAWRAATGPAWRGALPGATSAVSATRSRCDFRGKALATVPVPQLDC